MQWMIPQSGFILFELFILVAAGFWLYALVEIARSQFRNGSDKLTWLLLVILVPVVGVILYFSFGRKHRIKFN